jgi:hypothetical protein
VGATNLTHNNMTKTKKVTIAVSVDPALFEAIKTQASVHDRPVSNYVRSILKMIHGEKVEEETES